MDIANSALPQTAAQAAHPIVDGRRQEFEANKLRKRLRRQVGEAISDFSMIEAGDRVMVCMSGGKDSYGLLDILLSLQKRAPVRFDVVAVNLDQKQPGFPAEVLPSYLAALGVPFRIEEQDTYSVVKRVILTRRVVLAVPCGRAEASYRVARAQGHQDRARSSPMIFCTFFLNFFRQAQTGAETDFRRRQHVVIRPLAYVQMTCPYAEAMAFSIIPCDLCGSQEHLQRKQVSAMLREWEKKHPGRIETVFNALSNVVTTHLMDRKLQDFAAVRATGAPLAEGDIAFDDPCLAVPAAQRIRLDGAD
jgi:tRNA 2-thiocytidine biosynthesis protein TtcA